MLTPLVRADTGQRIIVNRGWVPEAYRAAETRLEGQTKGVVTVDAVVHNPKKKGKPNTFVPDNDPGVSCVWDEHMP